MEKKYSVSGIIGCVLFGIGDWLLGFVDPAKVNGDVFYFISAGHGAGYPAWKIIVTLITAVIGVLFMQQGCVHIGDLMRSDKDKAGAARVFTFMTYGWLILHLVVTINVYVYSYMCENFGIEQAERFSGDISRISVPLLYISYVIIIAAMADLILVIARGRTFLRPRDAFFTPLTWICLTGGISMLLPESAFSKGLYTFCMNGGMIVWFVIMMFMEQTVLHRKFTVRQHTE
ncbi:MAG: hypothetical protein J6N15_08555 [Ruminiclostridium sp.]|nr:hypothetical protein [Ruminiclostridium sp.]